MLEFLIFLMTIATATVTLSGVNKTHTIENNHPPILFIHDEELTDSRKILHGFDPGLFLISTLGLQDFLQLSSSNYVWETNQNHSMTCNNNLHMLSEFTQVVIVEMSTADALDLLFKKISTCLRSTGWKPVFIIHYSLKDPLKEHLEFLKRLAVKAKISINSRLLVVINRAKTHPSGEIHSVRTRMNGSYGCAECTVWEIYAIKDLPIVRQVELSIENITSVFVGLPSLNEKTFHRVNFYKAPISGAAENHPEFTLDSVLETVNGEVRFVSGFAVDLFQDLEHALNFSAIAVQGQGWISKDEVTSQWTGIGRQVMADEVDIGISMTLQNIHRADFAQLMPNYQGRVRAFFHMPEASSVRDIFKPAFNRQVWIVLMIVLTFTFINMKLMIYLKKKMLGECTKDPELTNDTALFIIASICQQGWHLHPNSTSLKIIFMVTTVSGFLVYVSFSAALVSCLTNEIIPITTVSELLGSSLFWIGDKYIPFVMSKLQSIYGLKPKALEDRNIAFDSYIINPTLRIAQEPCAFLGFSDEFISTLRAANKSDKYFCDNISTVKITKNRLKSGMVARKDSPFREFFNYGISKNIERGLNYARRERYVRRSRIVCDQKITSYREDLEPNDVFSAYLVLGVGLGVSLAMASVERYFSFKTSDIFYFR